MKYGAFSVCWLRFSCKRPCSTARELGNWLYAAPTLFTCSLLGFCFNVLINLARMRDASVAANSHVSLRGLVLFILPVCN